jgi:hypothetical protein
MQMLKRMSAYNEIETIYLNTCEKNEQIWNLSSHKTDYISQDNILGTYI